MKKILILLIKTQFLRLSFLKPYKSIFTKAKIYSRNLKAIPQQKKQTSFNFLSENKIYTEDISRL